MTTNNRQKENQYPLVPEWENFRLSVCVKVGSGVALGSL